MSTEQDHKEEQFQRLWEERQSELKGIIALTGPPYTMKTRLAEEIGAWARCPALCIEDFFSPRATTAAAAEGSDTGKLEAVQVQQHAFTTLCKVAYRHMKWRVSTVVVKSRFSSTFELQRLFDLLLTRGGSTPLLFIECRFTNEYLWGQHFEKARMAECLWREKEDGFSRWYWPGSWEEIMDKANRDYYSHSHHLITQLLLHQQYRHIRVRRLVVDPDEDIFTRLLNKFRLPIEFTDAIKYLLNTSQDELQLLLNINPPQHNHPSTTHINNNTIDYVAVEFRDLRPHMFERRVSARLAATNGRRTQTYCPGGDQCVFRLDNVHEDDNHVGVGVCCGVCGKQVVDSSSVSSYYACRLCILTLHKPCAERLPFNALHFSLGLLLSSLVYYHQLMPEKHACKSCSLDGGGTGFNEDCGSCQLQTHLKCGLLPTIIHHNSHPPHFLSLLVTKQSYRCSACGYRTELDFSYSCRPCGLYYHLPCALLPLQLLRHQHGGHQHVMRLLYSHHDTDQPNEEEEAYWCDVCGGDMDPHSWCYSCQDCPYYSAHLSCARGYEYLWSNVKNSVFIPQIQSQLKAAMAEVNSADSETPSESD